jgi:transcriptional regulator with GAF, ATPase, and Fis domain
MCNFHWPGNVRQLGNVLERAALFSQSTIGVEHLPQDLITLAATQPAASPRALDAAPPDASDDETNWPSMEDVERQHLIRTLEWTNYNQTAAARLLKLDRNAVRRLAQRLGVGISASKPR